MGRVRVPQPRPGRRAARTTSSASSPPTSSAGTSRTGSSRPTWPRSSVATGRSRWRPSARRYHVSPRTRRALVYVATRAARSTSTGASPVRSARPACRRRSSRGRPAEEDILRGMLDVRERRAAARRAGAGPDRVRGHGPRRPDPLAPGARRPHRGVLRRRARGPLQLHALPEHPPVGRVQPDRLPLPPERRRPRDLHLRGHVRDALRGRAAAAGHAALARRRRPLDRRAGAGHASAWCSTRTRSTWSRCRRG